VLVAQLTASDSTPEALTYSQTVLFPASGIPARTFYLQRTFSLLWRMR